MSFPPIHVPGDLYFVTGTIIDWNPLFLNSAYANIILESLLWHRANHRMMIFVFALMKDHIHWISMPIDPHSISDNIQSFASFTAHEILKIARLSKQNDLLDIFKDSAESRKRHKIWKDFQAKNIFTYKYLIQKMEYIHNNPIASEIHLPKSRANYIYSSACHYDLGKTPIIAIDDLFEYLDNLK